MPLSDRPDQAETATDLAGCRSNIDLRSPAVILTIVRKAVLNRSHR